MTEKFDFIDEILRLVGEVSTEVVLRKIERANLSQDNWDRLLDHLRLSHQFAVHESNPQPDVAGREEAEALAESQRSFARALGELIAELESRR